MFHSFSLRLMLVMVTLPVIALASVAFVIGRNNESQLNDYITARREARVAAGVVAEGVAPRDERTLFFLSSVPVNVEGDVEPQAFSVPLEQFDPELVNAQAIKIQSGDGPQFDVYGDPAMVQALDANRAATIGSLNNFVTLTTAVAAAAAVSAAYFVSRGVTRPVEALTAAARRLESGDLSQRVTVTSKDEVGELAHAFNEMAERMERNVGLRRRMASDVAHELRTPLNNLTGYLDAIADNVVEPRPDVVALLQQETESLVRLVQDVEQLSEADAGELPMRFESLDLRDVATTAAAAASARAGENAVELRVEAAEAPVAIEGDAGRLGQVVRNLLDNALRYTPPSGTISVAVSEQGGEALLAVEDTGPGIAPEHLPHIFDRFYRADASRARSTGGAGLGLAIARQIVEAHRGRITAGSSGAGGARFEVRLPLRI